MSSLDNSILPDNPVFSHRVPRSNDPALYGPKRRPGIFVTVRVVLMAMIAAVTGFNVVQPHLALDLAASQSQIRWMTNIYAINPATLLLSDIGAAMVMPAATAVMAVLFDPARILALKPAPASI